MTQTQLLPSDMPRLSDTDLSQLLSNAINGYESNDMDTMKLIPHMVEVIHQLTQRVETASKLMVTHGVIRMSATRSDKNHTHGKICNWRAKAMLSGGLGETAAEAEACTPQESMIRAAMSVLNMVAESLGAKH